MKNCLLILLLAIANLTFGQRIFDKEFKLGAGPFASDIHGTFDGGLLIVSSGDSLPTALTRIDSIGSVVWAKDYPFSISEIKVLPNSDIAIRGAAFIAMLNAQGNLLWRVNSTRGISSFDIDSNGNIFITGSQGSSGYVAKLDATGTWLWGTQLNDFQASSIAIRASGGAYLVGNRFNNSSGDYNKGVLLRMSDSGTIVWTRKTLPEDFDFREVIETSDQKIVLAGTQVANFRPHQLASLDSAGTLLWQKSIGPIRNRYDIVYDLIALPNGGYAYAGVSSDGPLFFTRDAFVGVSTSPGTGIDLNKNMQYGTLGTQNGMSATLTLHTNNSVGYVFGEAPAGLPPYSSHFGTLPLSGPACKTPSFENGPANYLFLSESFNATAISNSVQTVVPASAQPIVAYSLPICQIGCSILASPSFTYSNSADTIFFTNTSTNAGSFLWNFGAIDTSTTVNPYFIVPASGDYNICLTAYDSCGSNTTCQIVTACIPPSASFSTINSGLSVSFSNTSTNGVSSQWSFGDNATSTTTNPTHTYSQAGTYNVCLITSNLCGHDTLCMPVTICQFPTSNFSFTNSNLTFQFANLSNLDSTWVWDFGDGMTSLDTNAVHTYSQPGNYTVCLITSNSCYQDTTCIPVTACYSPLANFSFTGTNQNIQFTNTSSMDSTWHWDFGDTQTSSLPNPMHQYASGGTYTVCLIASNTCGQDTFCQTVQVCAPPIANFSFTNSNLTYQFTNLSNYDSTWVWLWTFGDGSSDTAPNPSHTYLNDTTLEVCLIASYPCGTDTFCQTIQVCAPPIANFSFTNSNLTYQFTNLSNYDSTWVWLWTFGDGSSNTVPNPSHTYLNDTTLEVCLIATKACGSDTFCQQITLVGNDESYSQAAFQILPNPAQDQAWIVLNAASPNARRIKILDLQGRMVATYEIPAGLGETKVRLDLNGFVKGLYFVGLQGEGINLVKRLLIE